MLGFGSFLAILSYASCFNVVKIFRIVMVSSMLAWVAVQCKQYIRICWLALRLPGPLAYPIIGNTYMIFNNKRLFYLGSHIREEYGSIVRAWVSIYPVIFILDPVHVQKVLLSGKHIEKTHIYAWMSNLIGRGLVTSEGSTWRRHRRMIQPAFGLASLEDLVPRFENGTLSLIQALLQAMEKAGTTTLNVAPFINDCIFNILSENVFGIPMKLDSKGSKTSPFRNGTTSMQERLRRPWLMLEPLYRLSEAGKKEAIQRNLLESSTRKLIAERKNARGHSKNERSCLLDFMMGLDLTDEECVDEVSTFMLAGQDTVAGALAFALHLFAQHPQIQERVIAEVDGVFGDGHSATRHDIRQLTYIEQCVKEVLRLFPSVPGMGRKLVEDIQLDEYNVPAGTEVIISPYATHRLPEYFPDPEKFDPDRFSLNVAADRHPCAYIPFSAGPRNCIGSKFAMIELQTMICTIFRKFRISLPPGQEELSLKYRVTIRASGGIWIKFSDRCKPHQETAGE